jgi:hypothetical protein
MKLTQATTANPNSTIVLPGDGMWKFATKSIESTANTIKLRIVEARAFPRPVGLFEAENRDKYLPCALT